VRQRINLVINQKEVGNSNMTNARKFHSSASERVSERLRNEEKPKDRQVHEIICVMRFHVGSHAIYDTTSHHLIASSEKEISSDPLTADDSR